MTEGAYVLDTHALLWYLSGNKRLSARVREILDRADDDELTVIVPTIVLAEALRLIERAKFDLTVDALTDAVRDANRFTVSPLDARVFTAMLPFPQLELHDRAIAATCKVFDCPLLSRDRDLTKAVTTIW